MQIVNATRDTPGQVADLATALHVRVANTNLERGQLHASNAPLAITIPRQAVRVAQTVHCTPQHLDWAKSTSLTVNVKWAPSDPTAEHVPSVLPTLTKMRWVVRTVQYARLHLSLLKVVINLMTVSVYVEELVSPVHMELTGVGSEK